MKEVPSITSNIYKNENLSLYIIFRKLLHGRVAETEESLNKRACSPEPSLYKGPMVAGFEMQSGL